MLKADELHKNQTCINGKWVVARPLKQPLPMRIRDAIEVLKGDAEAVTFETESHKIKHIPSQDESIESKNYYRPMISLGLGIGFLIAGLKYLL